MRAERSAIAGGRSVARTRIGVALWCAVTAVLTLASASAGDPSPDFTAYAFAATVKWDVTGTFTSKCNVKHDLVKDANGKVVFGPDGKPLFTTGDASGKMHLVLRTIEPAKVIVGFTIPGRVPKNESWLPPESVSVWGGLQGRAAVTIRNTGTVPSICAPITVDPSKCHASFNAFFTPWRDAETRPTALGVNPHQILGKAQVASPVGITGNGDNFRQTFCFANGNVRNNMAFPYWWPGSGYANSTIPISSAIRNCGSKRLTFPLTTGDVTELNTLTHTLYSQLTHASYQGHGTLTLTRIRGWKDPQYLAPKIPGVWGCQ